MRMEHTLIVIKPDGIRRRLVGKIISKFEDKGFNLKKLRFYEFSTQKAREFYSVHRDKPFFSELVSFLSSGPVLACVLEGNNAISVVRLMIGATNSTEAAPGTLRGDYALGLTDNIIHASDSPESFIKESGVIFNNNL